MEKQKTAKVQGWLEKGKRDLYAAQRLASGGNPLFDYAVFHCQQAAEKAIKAVLVFHDQEWDKRQGHNLECLIQLAAQFERNIDSRKDFRDLLTKYAVDPRYPDFGLGTDEQFNNALHNAEGFYEYILELLRPKINCPKQATSDSA